jgi:CDP-glucose 4,6-dehydratase
MEGMVMGLYAPFWHAKRVLLTGHTGFKGSWLALWLARLGAYISGVSLPPGTHPNLFTLARVDKVIDGHYCDIRDGKSLASIVHTIQPDIVLHLAAQPLVRASYRAPVDTMSTNVMGTVNLLDAIRGVESVRVAVMVTTDKVYKNGEGSHPYCEGDPLGGDDPYSASKAASELAIESYRTSFFTGRGVAVASARAGNVMGGGDWSEDRLIPDAIRAWQAGKPLHVRRPQAVRPWQHVLDPLCGYLRLAETLWEKPELAGSYNFGPHTGEAVSVRDVVGLACLNYGGGEVVYGNGSDGPHEAKMLTLEIARARAVLGVVPKWSLATAVERTMRWYRRQADGSDASTLCEEDIAAYEEAQ